MVVGYNHNVRYKGDLFHLQTEDGGIGNPFITSLLYRGGAIISSKKTSYADIIKVDMLGQIVEELMKEQHKDMLRSLKAGEFDNRAFPVADKVPAVHPAPPVEAKKPLSPEPEQKESLPRAESPPGNPAAQPERPQQSLDEVIFNYLLVDDK